MVNWFSREREGKRKLTEIEKTAVEKKERRNSKKKRMKRMKRIIKQKKADDRLHKRECLKGERKKKKENHAH